MAEFDLLVLNGTVVTDQETRELDIAVQNGKIAKVCPRGSLVGVEAKKTIDAQGGLVMVRGLLYSSAKFKLTFAYSQAALMHMCKLHSIYLLSKKY
jgi:predicted amidohydrolase